MKREIGVRINDRYIKVLDKIKNNHRNIAISRLCLDLYSYNGLFYILKDMVSRGLILKKKVGRKCEYKITDKGIKLIEVGLNEK